MRYDNKLIKDIGQAHLLVKHHKCRRSFKVLTFNSKTVRFLTSESIRIIVIEMERQLHYSTES